MAFPEKGLPTNPTTKPCPQFALFNTNCEAIPIYCHQWRCDHCRRVLSQRWAVHAWQSIERWDGSAYFLTLTLWGSITDPKEGYSLIPRYWDNFRKGMQRDLDDFSYIAFVEGQAKRNGMPHFHIISRDYPYGKRLKDRAVDAGFGYQAKKELVVSKGAAAYVSKYVSKGDPNIPKGFRRVRTSRDVGGLPDPPEAPYPLIPRVGGMDDRDYCESVSKALAIPLATIWELYAAAIDKLSHVG